MQFLDEEKLILEKQRLCKKYQCDNIYQVVEFLENEIKKAADSKTSP